MKTALLCCLGAVLCSQLPYIQGDTSFVKNVHVIFMNHLDVGYDGLYDEVGFINNVLNRYFQEYFPRAWKLGKQLSEAGFVETFTYTTHPWLVSMYMNCPQHLTLGGKVTLQCPNKTDIGNFTEAVKAGYITWHAGPMNMQSENGLQWLYDFGLKITTDLDKMFGISRKTRALSQRDVPGMTQAVIPSLVKARVSGVSVGVNDMSAPPAVPQLFVWRYHDYEVLGTWHAGGYPDNAGPDPKHPGGLSLKDCVVVQNFSDALCFAFRTDNSGPPIMVQEVLGYYEILRAEFPQAKIMASTLENFFMAVEPIKSKLPVITKEIGDTWIQGIASDPRKIAEFRAVARVMDGCYKHGQCSLADVRVYNASRFLLKISEHTWGLNTAADTGNWTNKQFHKYMEESKFTNCTESWLEQREFTYLAVSALQNHSVVQEIKQELENLQPSRPDLEEFQPVSPVQWTAANQCGDITVGFSMEGDIDVLKYKGVDWASSQYPLARFIYNTYNQTDMDEFSSQYNYNGNSAGYVKTNATASAHPESRTWPTALRDLYRRSDGSCDFYLHIEMLDKRTWQYYGAPQDIWVQHTVRKGTEQTGIDTVFQWFDKTSTRLAESMLFSFSTMPQPSAKWQMSKLGQIVDPMNVILNGSQYQHAIDDGGIMYGHDGNTSLYIYSQDVSVACPMANDRQSPPMYPAPLTPIPTPVTGFAFSLYNNVWNTNYIFWYPYIEEDADFKARFSMQWK